MRKERGDEGEEGVKLGKAVEPAREQAGVDRAGDVGGGLDRGDDGHVEDLGHVPGRQGALRLGDEDDPVGERARAAEDGCQGEVAGSPHHRVTSAVGGTLGGVLDPPGVEHG